MVLYLGADFQPDVQRAVGQLGPSVTTEDLLAAPGLKLLAAGDLGKEALAGNKDPHVWLSPVQMQTMADAAAAAITAGAPELSDRVATALPVLKTRLRELDTKYRSGLTGCQSTELVTGHAAFGYIADEYGLRQVPIAGLSPDAEPDPKTLQSIAEVAKANNVKTVFFEGRPAQQPVQDGRRRDRCPNQTAVRSGVRPTGIARPGSGLYIGDNGQPRPHREGIGMRRLVNPGATSASMPAPRPDQITSEC